MKRHQLCSSLRIGIAGIALVVYHAICMGAPGTTMTQALLTATTATVAVTSGTTAAATLHFQFVANAPTGFWKLVRAGAEQAARDTGASVDFLVMVEGTETEQKRLADLAIARRVDGLAIAPAPGTDAAREIDRVAGITPVITVVVDVPSSRRRCFIGSDQYHAGLEAGRALGGVVKATSSTRIGVFAGVADDPVVRERVRGVSRALAGKFRIVGPLYDSGLEDKAESNVAELFAGNPDLAGAIGISRHNGPVIARVLRNRPMPEGFKVVCFDEELETVAAISDGRIYASVVEDPFEIGYRAVSLLRALARGDIPAFPDKGIVNTGVKVLRAGGINEFVRQLTTKSKRME